MQKSDGYQSISSNEVYVTVPKTSIWKATKDVIRSTTVEPIAGSIMIVMFMYSLISQQYIHQYVATSYGLNSTAQSSACENSSAIEAKVSADSSEWVLYVNIAGFAPSLVTTVILGSWSDTVGRRLPLLIGLFGYSAMIVCYLVVITFQFPIQYILIGRIITGFTGELPVILACVFSYIADISSTQNLLLRLAIAEGFFGLGGITGALLSGVWVQKQGFIPPFIFLTALMCATILYVFFYIKESLNVDSMPMSVKMKALFSLKPYRSIKNTLFVDVKTCFKILGSVACFLLVSIIIIGSGDVSTLYVLSPPFCWGPLAIGYASALGSTAFLFATATVKLLKGKVSDYVMGLIGIFSKIGGTVFYAFGNTSWLIVVGIMVQSFSTIMFTLMRSITSKLVGSDGQGSVFSIMALAQSTASLVGSFIFNPIYSETVAWLPGFVYIVLLGFEIALLALFSLVYYYVKDDIAMTSQSYEEIPHSDEDCYENH